MKVLYAIALPPVIFAAGLGLVYLVGCFPKTALTLIIVALWALFSWFFHILLDDLTDNQF